MISGTIQHLWKQHHDGSELLPPYAEARYGYGSSLSDVIACYALEAAASEKNKLQLFQDAFPEHVVKESLIHILEHDIERFACDSTSIPLRLRFFVSSLANRYARVHWSLVSGERQRNAMKSDEYPEKLLHALQDWADAMLHDEALRQTDAIVLDSPSARALDNRIEFIYRYGALSQWAGSLEESPLKRLTSFLALQMPDSPAAVRLVFRCAKTNSIHELFVNKLDDIDLSCVYKLTQFDHVEAVPRRPGISVEDVIMQILKKLTANSWASNIMLHKEDGSESSSIKRD